MCCFLERKAKTFSQNCSTVWRFDSQRRIRIQGVSKTEIKAVMLRIQDAVASLYGYPEPRGTQLES